MARPQAHTPERLSQPQRAYELIRRMILDNRLSPGTCVLQEALAEAVGVSRTPVREALIRLEKEGLVEIRPRHGMYVKPVSADSMREIYDVLTALEGLAARRLAERGLVPAEMAALLRAVEEMDVALATEDLAAWADADDRFHQLLVEFAGNERLTTMVSTVVDQAFRVRRLTLKLRPKPFASNADHRALLKAIEDRDADGAYAVHTSHRRRSGEMLCQILESIAEEPPA